LCCNLHMSLPKILFGAGNYNKGAKSLSEG
jgi:hypothetical protein